MLFDSHCHLQFDDFNKDRNNVIQRLVDNHIFIINVGSNIENSNQAIELANKYSFMWASVGMHPSEILKNMPTSLEDELSKISLNLAKFKTMAQNPKVVAIGECGLDFSYFKDIQDYELYQDEYKNYQYTIFRQQIQLANELNKPIILHIRKLYEEAIEILEKEKFNNNVIFHFFKGKQKDLDKIVEHPNYYISFSGVITYDDSLDKIIYNVPLERLLVETDAPYVAPMPKKGVRNEPLFVKYTIEHIAKVKNLSLSKIEQITYENTLKVFNIPNV